MSNPAGLSYADLTEAFLERGDEIERLTAEVALQRELNANHAWWVTHGQEAVAMVAERDATIERIKTLADGWGIASLRIGTHWDGCDMVHGNCFVLALRAALTEPS